MGYTSDGNNGYIQGKLSPGQFGIMVKDMAGPVYYKPNIDVSCENGECIQEIVEQYILDPVKLAEERRWELLAKQRDIEADIFKDRYDIDRDLRNDEIERKQKALVCFDYMKNDVAKLIAICELLEIRSYHGMDENLLRSAVFTRINSDQTDRRGRKFRDLFIEIMTMEMENESKPKPVNIRFAHMIRDVDKPELEQLFRRKHGDDWKKQVQRALFDYKRSDFLLAGRFSTTILDENTILVYPNDYKKPVEVVEPLWYEEDLVTSQSYFTKENEKSTGIVDFIYHIFT